MSNVLVIQPYKMLQQAFAMALCPEHQLRVMDALPEDSAITDVDAVVVDAVSLAKHNTGTDFQIVKEWKVPTVWIDNGKSPEPPTRDNLFIVHWPTQKATLRKALLECLAVATRPAPEARHAPVKGANRPKQEVRQKAEKLLPNEPKVIELVEVVEAPPLVGQTKTSEKKQ
jgi:hypothetical protein